jgi:ABC-type antimicrobial peptide transport system permease subunit
MRAAARAVEPTAPLYSIATMDERLQTTLAGARFNTMLMLLLGVIGLVLAAVGVYGLIAYVVTQRRREIAIRLALGATAQQVVRMVLQQGLTPVWIGVVIGLLTAVSASRVLSAYVYGITTRDPLTLAAVVAVLVVSAVIATLVPARTAARVDPAPLLLM